MARLYDLIGAKLPFYDLLPGNIEGHVSAGGARYAWGSWADVLEPQAGTTTLATYSDQFYAGKSAAVTHKLGKGTVTYIGVDTTTGDLEAALLRKVYAAAGAAPASAEAGLPRGLARRLLGGHQFHLHAADDSRACGRSAPGGNAQRAAGRRGGVG